MMTMTFNDLWEAHVLRTGKSADANQKSALKMFVEALGREFNDDVNQAFGEEYRRNLEKFELRLRRSRKCDGKGSVDSKMSRLNQIRITWDRADLTRRSAERFRTVLNEAFSRLPGLTCYELATRLLDKYPECRSNKVYSTPKGNRTVLSMSLKGWRNGACPSALYYPILPFVERELGIEGQLVSALPPPDCLRGVKRLRTVTVDTIDGMPLLFRDKLRAYRMKKGLSGRELWKLAGGSGKSPINSWECRRAAGVNWRPFIATLDDILSASGNLLRSFEVFKSQFRDAYSERLSRFSQKPYGTWSDVVEAEFRLLADFKLGQDLSSRRWESDQTKLGLRRRIARFFGWLTILDPNDPDPAFRGRGYKGELSLALLASPEYALEFAEFKKVRSGIYHRGIVSDLRSICSLLRRDTGFLWLNSEMFARHSEWKGYLPRKALMNAFGKTATVALTTLDQQWKYQCESARKEMLAYCVSVRAGAKGEFGLSRDPKSRIRRFIRNPDPMKVPLRMARIMESNLLSKEISPFRWALGIRNLLLIKFLTHHPKRRGTITQLKLNSHLMRTHAGEWHVDAPRYLFKNRKKGHAAANGWQARLSRHLWPLMDLYVNEARPIIVAHAKLPHADFLFITPVGPRKDSTKVDARIVGISQVVLKATQACEIEEAPDGINIHAFRMIVPTDIISRDPINGTSISARIILDHKRTVDRDYSQVVQKVKNDHSTNILDERVDDLLNGSE